MFLIKISIFFLTILASKINGNKLLLPVPSESAQNYRAIVDVANIFAEKSNDHFELIQYSRVTSDISNEIVKNFPNIIFKKLIYEVKGIPVKNPTIVICKKFSDILSLTLNMYLINIFPKEMVILVYCEEVGNFTGFDSFHISTLMNFQIHPFLYVLNSFGDGIELKTLRICILVITCDPEDWVTINVFNKTTNSWTKPLKIPKKHQNLNRTEIVLGIYPNAPVNRFKLINNDTDVVVSGIASDIARIVAEIYNFTIYFQPMVPPKTATGTTRFGFKLLKINRITRIPVVIIDIVRVVDGSNFMAAGEMGYCMTQPFMNLNRLLIVTPGDLYTSYEVSFIFFFLIFHFIF